MDFSECVKLLENHRQHDNHDHATATMGQEQHGSEEKNLAPENLDLILKALPELSPAALEWTRDEPLHAVIVIHRERVRVSKAFDDALAYVIDQRELGCYHMIIQIVAAQFQSLSASIRSLIDLVSIEEQGTIRELQQHEKERLELQAALHMEKIKLVNATCLNEEQERRFASSELKKLRKRLDEVQEEIEELVSSLLSSD